MVKQPEWANPELGHDWDDRVISWHDNSDYEHTGTFVCQKCHAHYDDPEALEPCGSR